MLDVDLEPGKPLLTLRASGVIRAGDFQECMPSFEKLVAETSPRGLLFDWTELEGWSEEAESIRFFARLQLPAILERVAILADDAWDAEVSRFQEVTHRSVRHFAPDDRQSALAWLEANS